MKIELLNKLSNLAFCGFYNPANGLVCVHFFNEKENKSDIIAYLQKDMSWDVREIVSEESTVHPDCEEVKINHKLLGIELANGKFDEFVRVGLEKLARQSLGEDVNLAEADKVFEILGKNSYE